jgi:hypothetical protein
MFLRTSILTLVTSVLVFTPVTDDDLPNPYDAPVQDVPSEVIPLDVAGSAVSVPESDASTVPDTRTPVEVPIAVPADSDPVDPPAPKPFDYVVPVSCPQEDTCRLDYTSDAQWVLIYGETYSPDRVFSVVLPVTCPQEDDCAMDYRGDLAAWVITENAPH